MATDICVEVYVSKTTPYTPKTPIYTPICVPPVTTVNFAFMDDVDFAFMDNVTFGFMDA